MGEAISPVDGRYRHQVEELADFSSEMSLMLLRTLVEAEWLIFLARVNVNKLSQIEVRFLRGLYQNFSKVDYERIKEIEKVTNHDVNAVVRYIQERLQKQSLTSSIEFVHFGLTSEDVNNIAFAFQILGALCIVLNYYDKLMQEMKILSNSSRDYPMLAHTHGQPASTTTVGWEINVFYARLLKVFNELDGMHLEVKFGGATGGHNALYAAYPQVDWRSVSQRFIRHLSRLTDLWMGGLLQFRYNPYCTQRESMDSYARVFSGVSRMNTVLLDFDRDMWTYISRDIFRQIPKDKEVGSSTMPHKVNPIDFENSEGNLGLANALFGYFIAKLPISREQRDLSDSTVARNFGVAFAHTLLAVKSAIKGLGKVTVNQARIAKMLDANWAILAEAIQTILRRERVSGSYDLLKDLTRGKAEINQVSLRAYIMQIAAENHLSKTVVDELLALTPASYIGNRQFDIDN